MGFSLLTCTKLWSFYREPSTLFSVFSACRRILQHSVIADCWNMWTISWLLILTVKAPTRRGSMTAFLAFRITVLNMDLCVECPFNSSILLLQSRIPFLTVNLHPVSTLPNIAMYIFLLIWLGLLTLTFTKFLKHFHSNAPFYERL